ncbi:hypothetical protein GDO81_027743 [Engystomops pustulosus]|uniref:Uncharacterized protein n=1 Tax=Engystomops pustulosus TaxID=76066 RepID=A0AAV6Z3R9_ENGPU|nr:hypothetical protein GDO81_027743 [Engystomops pustulosus]
MGMFLTGTQLPSVAGFELQTRLALGGQGGPLRSGKGALQRQNRVLLVCPSSMGPLSPLGSPPRVPGPGYSHPPSPI